MPSDSSSLSSPFCARFGGGVSLSTVFPRGVGRVLLSGEDVRTSIPISLEPSTGGAQPIIIPSAGKKIKATLLVTYAVRYFNRFFKISREVSRF